jgi:ATP/maltotriose-dependent transcriptional regulator MalT
MFNSQFMLEYLERANLFIIALDTERRWYCYHPLLAEFLRSRLHQHSPEQLPELHRRVAAWYARAGFADAAAWHAQAAHDAEQPTSAMEYPASGSPHGETPVQLALLSERELDVLWQLVSGKSNQEIADTLIIGVNTVKMHLKHIYAKLDAHSRVQAIAQARALGLVQ